MKKYLVFLLMFILATAVSFLSVSGHTTFDIPRVDLIGLEQPEILDLTALSEKTAAYIMYQSDDVNFIQPVTVKLSDADTLSYEKKDFEIEIYRDENFTELQNVTLVEDWGAYSKYCLKANYLDSTHARNVVSAEVAGLINSTYGLFPDSPNGGMSDGIPVELYIDREYHGIYTLNIALDPWMFGMDAFNENNIVMKAVTWSDSILFMAEASGVENADWNIVFGPENLPVIYEKLNRAIRFVMESSDEEYKAHFSEYFDLDASLNYYCLAAYFNATGNMGRNMLLATFDGNVWYPSLYNLDTSFGLFYNGEGIYSVENPVEAFQGGTSLFWKRLVENFPQELAQRYWKMRQSFLKESFVMGLFEAFTDSIPEETWERERETWPDVPGVEYDIESVREHIQGREPYLDDFFTRIMPEPERVVDSRLLFELELPYKGKTGSWLDTGVNLYAEDMDYTIFLKFKTGQQEPRSMVILSDSNNSQHGLIIQTAGNGTDDYTAFFAGEHVYEALYPLDSDGYVYITIRRKGDDYTFFGNNINDVRRISSSVPTEISTNLVLGARINLLWDGTQEGVDYYTGRIQQCRVYNEALEDAEIEEILAALKTE